MISNIMMAALAALRKTYRIPPWKPRTGKPGDGHPDRGSKHNIYKSVGTVSYTSTKAITEHGLFNKATAGTLLDRTVFSAVNVVSGDACEFTYEYTVSTGG